MSRGLIAIGIESNPQHPGLLALLDAGVKAEQIVATGRELLDKQQGRPPKFAYVLATVRGRIEDAQPINSGAPPPSDYGESDVPTELGSAAA